MKPDPPVTSTNSPATVAREGCPSPSGTVRLWQGSSLALWPFNACSRPFAVHCACEPLALRHSACSEAGHWPNSTNTHKTETREKPREAASVWSLLWSFHHTQHGPLRRESAPADGSVSMEFAAAPPRTSKHPNPTPCTRDQRTAPSMSSREDSTSSTTFALPNMAVPTAPRRLMAWSITKLWTAVRSDVPANARMAIQGESSTDLLKRCPSSKTAGPRDIRNVIGAVHNMTRQASHVVESSLAATYICEACKVTLRVTRNTSQHPLDKKADGWYATMVAPNEMATSLPS
mmetsp:Transcript_114837/g.335877  ORF Transcript_114837/g.335877 Transcript_114837/m.335877 type:complete len:290 (+) Transcript_114837:1159-2028(+)